jgi:hypothetical protein
VLEESKMRRMVNAVRRTGWLFVFLTLATALVQGCSSDPTNLDPGDPTDPPGNTVPTASAGADAAVSIGIGVGIDGSGSADADGDALTYAWTLVGPTGTSAALDDATSATPAFVPDVEGAYVATLTVNDGTDDSVPDAVTITATDNTATASVVAAAGGSLASSDGALSMTVPAGALAADTDISVTPLAEVQFPAAVRDLPGELLAYDLQPDGTMFSTPVEVAFEIDDAVTNASGSAEIAAAFLISESEGMVESMTDVVLAQDAADPTKATLTGGLSHFSRAVFASPSLTFKIGAPDEARVDEPFDVTFTLDLTGLTDPTFTAFTTFLENLSDGPVAPEPQSVFRQDFPTQATVSVVTNSYVCSDAGEGEVRVKLEFAAPPLVALIQLAKDVECTVPPPPLETTLIPNLYRAKRLLPVPGAADEITTGGSERRINLSTKAVTEYGQASQVEWVSALSDGNYLVYSELGRVSWFVPGGDPMTDTMFVSWFDQPRHVTMVSENTIALASAFGDLGFITYTPGGASGSFRDAFRDLESQTNPQQDPATNLQAIWVSPDAQTFIGAVTEGDGDSAFERTQAAILNADVQSGQISVTLLPDVIDLILDSDLRHQFDLDCGELEGGATSELLCVFTSGFDGPAFDSPGPDLEGDGYLAIFTVDPFDQSSELLYWEIGNAYVGASVFPFDGNTTGVAVANQFTGDIDVWHVRSKVIADAFTVSLAGQCEAPIDLILVAFGARGALACQATTPSLYSVLVIENLDLQQPPIS